MATVYGSLINSVWRAYLTYSQTNTSNTVTTVTVSSGINIPTSGNTTHRSFRDSISATGKSSISGTRADQQYKGVNTTQIASGSWQFTRTHSAQTIELTGYLATPLSGTVTYSSTAKATITIPARTSYKVTFNANGGSGAPSAQTKWHDETLTLSSTKPTKSGYTFVGWNTSSTATTSQYAAGGSYTANSAATLYAIWKKTLTVTYNANGGSGAPGSQSATVYNGTTSYKFTLSSTKPTKSGYTFVGWNTSSSATTSQYAAGRAVTISSNITLYAIWKKTLTLTYNANGGSTAPASQSATVYNGTTSYTFTLSSTRLTRTGYDFLGWSTNSGATTASYQPGGTITISSSTTLYAVWKRKPVFVKVSGAWKSGYIYVKVNGTWKEAKGVSVKAGGTWHTL